MMYPFMTLDDGTEVVHSEILEKNGQKEVKVYFEKPIEGGFHYGTCFLPDYKWEDIHGFRKEDIQKYTEFLETTAHLVYKFASQGGFGNAANI